MVLTVDIGNTNIVLGVFDQDELVFTARVSTDKNRTADEYSVLIHGIFEINGFDLSRFDGIILSSVVPRSTRWWPMRWAGSHRCASALWARDSAPASASWQTIPPSWDRIWSAMWQAPSVSLKAL